MKSKHYKLWRANRCIKMFNHITSGLFSIVLCSIGFNSIAQTQVSYYELENGLLLDIANNSVIVMNPNGSIESLQMTNGSVNWQSDQAAKPLAIHLGSLIAQQENTDLSNKLRIAQLNPTNGNLIRSREKTLDPKVVVTVANARESSFNAHVDIVNNQINFKYDFAKYAVTLIEDSQKENPNIFLSRKYRLNGANLNLDSVADNNSNAQSQWQSVEFYTDQLNSSYPGRQFKAIQDNYRVAVEKIADDREWLKYEWTIFSANGTRIGSILSHFSFRPFYIENGLIIFTTMPFERILNGEIVSEPKSIRGYNLTSGNEVWSKEIRDLQYRGPYPP